MVLLRNDEILTKKARQAASFFGRMKGLIGKEKMDMDEVLILSPCIAVHTFFMRFPLDIVFLNAKGSIVALYPKLKPYRLTKFHLSAATALELPAGTIEKWKLENGQTLVVGERDV